MSDLDTFEDNNAEESLMVNLAEVEEQSFETMPKGKYPIVVEDMEYSISKSSGKPMWTMTFMITEGEFANRKLWSYFSFSQKALPMTKGNIAALDPDMAESSFDPKVVADEKQLTGKTALATIGIQKATDEYDEKNVIKSLAPLGGGDDDLFDA